MTSDQHSSRRDALAYAEKVINRNPPGAFVDSWAQVNLALYALRLDEGTVKRIADLEEQNEALKAEVDGMARAPYGQYQKMRERAERAEEQLKSRDRQLRTWAEQPCWFVEDNQGPACPEEWPDQDGDQWCVRCFSRLVLDSFPYHASSPASSPWPVPATEGIPFDKDSAEARAIERVISKADDPAGEPAPWTTLHDGVLDHIDRKRGEDSSPAIVPEPGTAKREMGNSQPASGTSVSAPGSGAIEGDGSGHTLPPIIEVGEQIERSDVLDPASSRRIEVEIAGDGSGVALPPIEESVPEGLEPRLMSSPPTASSEGDSGTDFPASEPREDE